MLERSWVALEEVNGNARKGQKLQWKRPGASGEKVKDNW